MSRFKNHDARLRSSINASIPDRSRNLASAQPAVSRLSLFGQHDMSRNPGETLFCVMVDRGA
jgi:hypothetical protein